MELTRRYRVNVGTSVKGVKTFDCTVEVSGDLPSDEMRKLALLDSDLLVAELDKRYPPPDDTAKGPLPSPKDKE